MKIFDCFPYWREYSHVKARQELWQKSGLDVEMIAMVGTHTHSGTEITYTDPIRAGEERGIWTVWVDLEMPGATGWDREFAQRGALVHAMRSKAGKEDLIISTDADEIVDPSMVDAIYRSCKSHEHVSLSMLLFYYGLDLIAPNTWVHGKAFRGRNIPDDLNALRNDLSRYAVPLSGWHISWQGGEEARSSKAMAFSHSEFANEEGLTAIRNGAKFGFDPHGNKLLPFDSSILPTEILKNLGDK